MNGQEYVWRVRLYYKGIRAEDLNPQYTKVFTNKVEALQYAASLEAEHSSSFRVEVKKWFGDDED